MNELLKLYTANFQYILLILAGALIICIGILVSTRKPGEQFFNGFKENRRRVGKSKINGLLGRMTAFFPLSLIKNNIKTSLGLMVLDEVRLEYAANITVLSLSAVSGLLIFLLRDIGQLWYVKILLSVMCSVLPFYVFSLVLELLKFRVHREIPILIDEFRSAFIKHNRVKPALIECSSYVNKSLGRIIRDAADSSFLESSLNNLKGRFNNAWFNIFVTLLINYKQNSGDLISQLYDLNRTMTRYTNVEKKKNKRLIWYEAFAVGASVFSIPAVFWLNSTILGKNSVVLVDATANMMISRILGYSVLSLVVLRVLRSI